MFWKIFLVIALIGSLSVSIRATANDVGCTYTQGHWKTHSVYGPGQPADDGWFTTFGPYPPGPGGPDAPLFDSGLTWIEALNTPSRGGNAWFILASQWMAAYLNYYNGAGGGSTDVVSWLANGAFLLDAYDQYDGGQPLVPKRSDDRAYATQLARWLADYNEGYIGPGACIECPCFDGIADDTPYFNSAISTAIPCPPDSPSDTEFGGVNYFEFATGYDVGVRIAGFCDGTFQYSCDGGPAGDFTLSAWQYEQCVAGPGWPPTIPD